MNLRHFLLTLLVSTSLAAPVASQELSQGHWYFGGGLGLLELDNERDNEQPDFSPEDEPFMLSLNAGYRYKTRWDIELSLATSVSGLSGQTFGITALHYWDLSRDWRWFVSGGFDWYDFSDLPVNRGDTSQATLGLGVAKPLTDNLELRLWYKHLYDTGGHSYSDEYIGLSLNYHLGKIRGDMKPLVSAPGAAAPPPPVVEAAPEPAPQPESVPKDEVALMTVELKVEFDTDKWDIRTVYQEQFDHVGALLSEYKFVNITIEGHTDWRADDDYNQVLSEKRSASVKEKLVQDYSIDPSRVMTVGYGESRPVASNETDEGMQRNRRAIAVFTVPKSDS